MLKQHDRFRLDRNVRIAYTSVVPRISRVVSPLLCGKIPFATASMVMENPALGVAKHGHLAFVVAMKPPL